jgi:hypothetical protein
MGYASAIEMKQILGEDEEDSAWDELDSPRGILVETSLNICTVKA